jgi:DNA-binding transcriptional MerR regulator
MFDWQDFEIDIGPEEPVFPLNVVCRLLDINYWTLRDILEEELINLKRRDKGKKLFSYRDMKQLKYIMHLIEDRGVNIKGVKVIFQMQGQKIEKSKNKKSSAKTNKKSKRRQIKIETGKDKKKKKGKKKK